MNIQRCRLQPLAQCCYCVLHISATSTPRLGNDPLLPFDAADSGLNSCSNDCSTACY